ncbi:hypothetical protein [Lysinibacillus capsici]|uniref:hypothetical protein n=1 Tax=Lysinibacillus capsici TaxID=2115968 RepID=UPI000E2084B6|nr:hypothetical protein [Lysinibacillus capsici]RDV27777.1 hypothetical protein C7B89_19560 [Lysinibacillus capsici]
MAIVPLKQKAFVRKYIADNNDGWATDDYAEPVEYTVRATERFEVVTNQLGEEVTTSLKLLFDKMPDVSYDDMFSFTNELGHTIERKPISIKYTRMVNGKVTLTSVFL